LGTNAAISRTGSARHAEDGAVSRWRAATRGAASTPNDGGEAACEELREGDVCTLAALCDIRRDATAFLEPTKP